MPLAFGWVTLTAVLEHWRLGDSIFNLVKVIFLFVSPIHSYPCVLDGAVAHAVLIGLVGT